MNALLVLSFSVALFCAEPARSSPGSVDEALGKVEAADAMNQLKRMNRPFRLRTVRHRNDDEDDGDDDEPSLFGGIAAEFKKINDELEALKSSQTELEALKTSVKTIKASVATLKSEKKMLCFWGWKTFTKAETRTITFNDGVNSCSGADAKCGHSTIGFSRKPSFIAALNQIAVGSVGVSIQYGSITTTTAPITLSGTIKGTNQATWMACGY